MRINNKNKNHLKRNLIILSVGALILVIGILGWYAYTSGSNERSENTVNYEPATNDQQSSGLKSKEGFNNTHYKKDDSGKTGVEVNKEVDVLISSMNQEGGFLTIAASVETVESGICELVLSREGLESMTMQRNAIKVTTYSACEDFIVDTKDFEKGEWNIKVTFMNDSTKGVTDSKVEIK